VFTPLLLSLAHPLVVLGLGDLRRVGPGEPVDRAVLGDVGVIGSVQLAAELIPVGGGQAVELGADQGAADVA